MKLLINVLALCCLIGLVGCQSSGANSTGGANMSAVSECPKSCEKSCADKCTGKAAPGAVSDKQCPSSCTQKQGDANMGAVSEKQCPMSTGSCTKSEGASMGAVSEKTGCCPSKSSCGGK